MRGQGKVPDCWIHRQNSLGTSGAHTSISWRDQRMLWFVPEDSKEADMARRCHRQKTRPHFIFIAEQFLGGGLHRASQDSFLDALRFIGRLSRRDTPLGGLAAACYPISHNLTFSW